MEKCKICGREFKTKQSLVKHIAKDHNMTNNGYYRIYDAGNIKLKYTKIKEQK